MLLFLKPFGPRIRGVVDYGEPSETPGKERIGKKKGKTKRQLDEEQRQKRLKERKKKTGDILLLLRAMDEL